MMRRRELFDRLASLLFPCRCALCGQVVEYDRLWCGDCPLPLLEGHLCGICGKPDGACICGAEPFAFAVAHAPFAYHGPVRDAVLRLKEESDRRTVRFFAEQMAQVLPNGGYSAIVPVPMAPGKRRERGYNPAELLALELGALLGLPVESGGLARRDGLPGQRGMDRAGRYENARRAYYKAENQTVGGHLLLIDDVLTTGATAHACGMLLLEPGVRISVLTAATTPLRETLGAAPEQNVEGHT